MCYMNFNNFKILEIGTCKINIFNEKKEKKYNI